MKLTIGDKSLTIGKFSEQGSPKGTYSHSFVNCAELLSIINIPIANSILSKAEENSGHMFRTFVLSGHGNKKFIDIHSISHFLDNIHVYTKPNTIQLMFVLAQKLECLLQEVTSSQSHKVEDIE